MKLAGSLRALTSAIFRRSSLEDDLQSELSAHIQARAAELERNGLQRSEAERRARIEFGSPERFKEEVRQTLGVHFVETFVQDARYALRTMRKSPAFSAIAVLTLALGIGANTAIFTLINAVMLRLLPVQRPQELLLLERNNPREGPEGTPIFTNPLWEQFRDHQDVFSKSFAWSLTRFDLAQGGQVDPANGVFASGDYFNALGIRPAAGRLFVPPDDQRGCAAQAVLSYSFWQSHFGGASGAVGSTISINRHPFQIIGVSAPGFFGMEVGSRFDIAVPICASAIFDGNTRRLERRSWWWLNVAGRVKPALRPDSVQARLAVLAPPILAAALPQDWDRASQQKFLSWSLKTIPARTGTSRTRSQFGQALTLLMAVVGVVLLIACANLASLLFARAAERNKEIAVRKALGASRSRLVRQLLTECLILSSAGALVGVFFARYGALLLVRYISPPRNPIFLETTVDSRVLAFTLLTTFVTAVFVGTLPALRSTRVSLTAAIKGGPAERAEQSTRFRPGKWMVASQVGLSLVLLAVAGTFLRSLINLARVDLGFDRSNVLLVNANLKQSTIPKEQREATYTDIEERMAALPAVISVGRSWRIPVSLMEINDYVQVDGPNPPKGEDSIVYFNFISAGYFRTLRTPMLGGRDFDRRDQAKSEQVAIVNETFARRFFPQKNAVGQALRILPEPGKPGPPIVIVGVVRDVKYSSIREHTYAQAYCPISQIPSGDESESYEIRAAQAPSELIPGVQSTVGGVNKSIALEFHSLAEQVDDSITPDRLLAVLSAFFGGVGLLLAMVGLYGVLSYLVANRQSEFGLRMALGAPPRSILQLVMRDVGLILGSGALAGLIGSLVVTRLIQQLLFGLNAGDPTTVLMATFVLAAVALLAAYLPARRAMRVDPMVVLRYE